MAEGYNEEKSNTTVLALNERGSVVGEKLKIYHGSEKIIEEPEFGVGKKYNDYGLGFYCTESIELAKEWACQEKKDGYANEYLIDFEGLNVVHLNDENHNILNWIAVLLKNRCFDLDSNVSIQAREYIITNFMPDISDADVIIGYRADDSYFSFAGDFVKNVISVRDLNHAMKLGKLGEQIVMISEEAFNRIEYVKYEIADYKEYYFKREARDQKARTDYKNHKKSLEVLKDDIFVVDIMRRGMRQDDDRLRLHLSE